MKKTTQLLTALICFALGGASVHAGLSYWDSNGTNAGAGIAPTGNWDGNTFWSTDSEGTNETAAWASGDTAVFSAGTDATDLFTVTVSGDIQPAGITFEEGVPTISGGSITMNAADFPIIANTNATITSFLEGIGTGFKKTGTGTLTLSGSSFHDGTDTVAEGVVSLKSATALGSGLAPTIVSNGAMLQVSSAVAFGEPAILNGSGVNNSGALRCIASPGNGAWTGGAVLGSDTRISLGISATWGWGGANIVGTNGGNNFNVTFDGVSGGSIRLNINGRGVNVGTGAIYKEGAANLQFETPSICSAFYLNGGYVTPRYPGFGSGNIYVGAGALGFLTGLSASPNVPQPTVLASGANPVFDVRTNTVGQLQTYTCSGVISGLGGLSKTNVGPLNLNAANTYSGNTTIQWGPLALGASGSIANSAVIDVWGGGTFDVSLKASGFVLGAAQTLKGNGTVVGNVTANGTLSPGASVGGLTNVGNLTLAAGAKLLIEVDKSLSPSNDVITVTGTLSHSSGGTVTVANLGPALTPGDSFQIFSQAVANGQTMTVAGGGATWINNLAANGSITVLAAAPPAVPATNLTIAAVGPASFSLGGSGAANSAYKVYASTNVTTPMTNWWLIGTTNSSAGGVIQFLDPQATNTQRFYRFGQPSP